MVDNSLAPSVEEVTDVFFFFFVFTAATRRQTSVVSFKGSEFVVLTEVSMWDRLTGGGQQGFPVHSDQIPGGCSRATDGVVPADAAAEEPATCS